MLSYQHIYHAGNLADVQKHALLAVALDYMCAKPKPLSYIETHSGRGLYDLKASEAQKTGEAEGGIGLAAHWFAPDHPYTRARNTIRAQHGEQAYPGSPLIAQSLLRPDDRMHFAELHPQEFDALNIALGRGPRIYKQDGFEMAQAVCPPDPRRGLLMIDPSYEVKADYDRIPNTISKLHRKWNVGAIALWYPILRDALHKPMLQKLEAMDLPKTLRHEVRFPPVREGHRMAGSGMFFLNAPYGLETEAHWLSQKFETIGA